MQTDNPGDPRSQVADSADTSTTSAPQERQGVAARSTRRPADDGRLRGGSPQACETKDSDNNVKRNQTLGAIRQPRVHGRYARGGGVRPLPGVNEGPVPSRLRASAPCRAGCCPTILHDHDQLFSAPESRRRRFDSSGRITGASHARVYGAVMWDGVGNRPRPKRQRRNRVIRAGSSPVRLDEGTIPRLGCSSTNVLPCAHDEGRHASAGGWFGERHAPQRHGRLTSPRGR